MSENVEFLSIPDVDAVGRIVGVCVHLVIVAFSIIFLVLFTNDSFTIQQKLVPGAFLLPYILICFWITPFFYRTVANGLVKKVGALFASAVVQSGLVLIVVTYWLAQSGH